MGISSAAAQKSFDPSVLLVARLAPDQYTFTRQVQAYSILRHLGVAIGKVDCIGSITLRDL